jgi:hypothetical protein
MKIQLFSEESLMSLALTTTNENTAIFRGVSEGFLRHEFYQTIERITLLPEMGKPG